MGEPIMTGFKSDKMRYDCHRRGCYYDQLPDWSDINDSFPDKIRPTDIDGMVEINGNVLFLEQKSVGAPITAGQARAFCELSKKDRTTVVAMRPGMQFEFEALFYVNGSGSGWQEIYRSDLLRWFELWSANAKNQKGDTTPP
jgi:hypothetical protein